MSVHKTPMANRLHISIFGKRNMGKSSLINAITKQNLAIVSDHAGTTTDPVYKSMEIAPLGPVTLIDTAGIDDTGTLGELRIEKSLKVLNKTDIALLVIDHSGFNDFDYDILDLFSKKNTHFIIVINKIDENKTPDSLIELIKEKNYNYIEVSATENKNIHELKELIIEISPKAFENPSIIGDLINPGDNVVLVIPIDDGMPRGRLILPEVQTMRDILDHNGIFHVSKDTELEDTLKSLKNKPKLVITDSQVFEKISPIVPKDIMLTSFSILFANHKGDLNTLVKGAKKIKDLKDGDKVLIAEACTHHTQKDDIGTVKLPKWIKERVNNNVLFDFVNGRDYPDNLKDYKLVLHCGGCMLNRKDMLSRIDISEENGVPIVNYGLAIASLNGILDRALEPFEDVYKEWNK